jgi:lysophospholipase L1-like esterase
MCSFLILAVSMLSGCAHCPICSYFAGSEAIDPADYDHPVRVACVGDSITFGAAIRNRGRDAYPVQLGRLLGDKWEVGNFGDSGSTMLKAGNRSYWDQDDYEKALAFQPDAVVIMLGTNDTKPRNWEAHSGEFVGDYKELIASFEALPSKPRIWICKPVPSFPGNWDIADKVLVEEINPKIEQVAKETGVGLIDMHAAHAGDADLYPDKVHPNAEGAGKMAATIYGVLTGKPAPTPEPAAVEQ